MSQIAQSRRWLIGLGVAMGLVVSSEGWGQAAKARPVSKGAVEIEEITVTAQKREENIQETPISVTALSAGQLENWNVTNIVDLGLVSPNRHIQPNAGSPSSTTISMRGLQQSDPESAFQSSVGLYVDGAYISKMLGSNLDLENLERVEVLRGPQGTLYGRNTIGGAVNLITKKPTEERSITVNTQVGNYETFEGRMTVNVPLVGKNGFFQSDALGVISLRETAGYKTHDGYFQNALPASAVNAPNIPGFGGPASLGGGADYNNLNRVFTLTALRWQPTKEITIDYSFEYHRYRDRPTATQLTFRYPGAPVEGVMTRYVQKNRSDVTPNNALLMRDLTTLRQQRDDGNHRMHILTAAWDLGEVGSLGSVTLKSISSYRSFVAQVIQDLDGTPLNLAEANETPDVQHWSEELQWIGTAPRVHYILGGYYYGEYVMHNQDGIYFAGLSNTPYRNLLKTKSYSPFGQVTWTPPVLGDTLSLTVGARYTQKQAHVDHDWQCPNPATCALTPPFKISTGKAFGIHGSGAPGISPMGDISY
jgi:iron complex outermembrane receptor protein